MNKSFFPAASSDLRTIRSDGWMYRDAIQVSVHVIMFHGTHGNMCGSSGHLGLLDYVLIRAELV
jgi:hypothetical protein